MINKMINKIKKFSSAKMAWLLVVLFALSLIPILYLSGYDHATGDDLGYGYRAHLAWLDTHNLWQVIRAAAETVRIYWIGWQGTWFTIFLMAFQPEVFSPDAYWIVPGMMLAMNIGATSLVLCEFLVNRLQLKKSVFVCADMCVLAAMIQFFPSTKSGIFWYNGATHYIVPYSLAMLAIYCFLNFEKKPGAGWFAGALLCMTALGGSSYLAALLAPMVLVYLLVYRGRQKKYLFWLLIPLALEMAGLYISFASPGNKNRGGEEFGLSAGRVAGTILQCFLEGARTLVQYLQEKPAAILIVVFAAFCVYLGFLTQEKAVCRFRFPGLFALLMFASWCAMFAPGIYAGVEVSGGVPNTIWQIFVLTFLAFLLYLSGWAAYQSKAGTGRERTEQAGILCYAAVLALLCMLVLVNRDTVKETTIFKCYDYISSGQAADYQRQMEACKAILLDDSVKEVYLPPINDDQGPLMHMPVTADEENFTNRVVRDFYRKEKVLMRE